jgi:hypothetical protein
MAAFVPWIPYVIAIVGALLVLRAIVVIVRRRRFLRTAVRTRGTIVGFTTEKVREVVADSTRSSGMSSEEVTAYFPEVVFTTADGRRITFHSRHRVPDADCLGMPIDVIHAPSAPETTCEVGGWLREWSPVTTALTHVIIFGALAWFLILWMPEP